MILTRRTATKVLRRAVQALVYPYAFGLGCMARVFGRAPRQFLSFSGGFGDDLLLTCLAREFIKRGENPVDIATLAPTLFENNPDVNRVIKRGVYSRAYYHGAGRRCFYSDIAYAPGSVAEDTCKIPDGHILQIMAAKRGIKGKIEKRPYLFLTDGELAEGKIAPGQICIMSQGKQDIMPNKQWFIDRYQDVTDSLRDEMPIVQVGALSDVLLDGVIDRRGITFRAVAAVLANSICFIGQVGFLMHMARAVDCPAVIVYGGRELPEQSGYYCNINLARRPECSPCWKYRTCDKDRICMREITSKEVISATKQIIRAVPARPLPVEILAV
jgi:hypothetical protein